MKTYKLNGEIVDFEFHNEWWDFCSPKGLSKFLKGLADGEKAVIEINSPGGYVVYGVEMANMIKNSKAHIIAHVTGIAASMASVVACACDEIQMEEASFMMIHDPWGVAEGNADEMRKEAKILDQMKEVIMSFYRGKFKKCSEEDLAKLMSAETWYTGAECLANGLDCTVIKSDQQIAAKVGPKNFGKMPEAVAKLYSFKEIDADTKAAIEQAKADQADEGDGNAPSAEGQESAPADDGKGGEGQASASAPAAAAVENWEERYKGASKKINELTDERNALKGQLDALNAGLKETGDKVAAERDALKAEIASAKDAAEKDLGKIKDAGFENLDALLGAVSALKSDLEKSGKDLAECRQQLDHMKETRDLLTGAVLTPANTACQYKTFADAVDALGYAEAAHKYPELKASYRNKNHK